MLCENAWFIHLETDLIYLSHVYAEPLVTVNKVQKRVCHGIQAVDCDSAFIVFSCRKSNELTLTKQSELSSYLAIRYAVVEFKIFKSLF